MVTEDDLLNRSKLLAGIGDANAVLTVSLIEEVRQLRSKVVRYEHICKGSEGRAELEQELKDARHKAENVKYMLTKFAATMQLAFELGLVRAADMPAAMRNVKWPTPTSREVEAIRESPSGQLVTLQSPEEVAAAATRAANGLGAEVDADVLRSGPPESDPDRPVGSHAKGSGT